MVKIYTLFQTKTPQKPCRIYLDSLYRGAAIAFTLYYYYPSSQLVRMAQTKPKQSTVKFNAKEGRDSVERKLGIWWIALEIKRGIIQGIKLISEHCRNYATGGR